MFEYRVTKYDPARRDASGAFLGDDWISFGQVGQSFAGTVLTRQEYERVESAYIAAATSLISESGGTALLARDLENTANAALPFSPDQPLEGAHLQRAMRGVLRELYWARFEDGEGRFVHFGWDYYMYVGVPTSCPKSQQLARDLGLFVEPFASPLHAS